jgi:hypothetical protein
LRDDRNGSALRAQVGGKGGSVGLNWLRCHSVFFACVFACVFAPSFYRLESASLRGTRRAKHTR